MRQAELGRVLGYEQSYVSALENDLKQAPPAAFLDALDRALNLSADESGRLRQAREASKRRYAVPPTAARETFEFIHALFSRVESVNAVQLQGFRAILELGDSAPALASAGDGRLRRKDRNRPRREDPM